MIQAFKRLLAKATSKLTGSGIAYTLGGIPLSRLGDFESYLQAGSRKVWVSWKACDMVATSVMNTPYQLLRKGSVKPITVNGLSNLLELANEDMTFDELVYLTCLHVKFCGSAFWFKANQLPNNSQPRAIFPLNPKRVWIVPSKETGLIDKYIYHSNGTHMPLDKGDVIHFRRPHPNNDFYGLGDIEAGQELFNSHINRTVYEERYFANGAAPGAILINEDQVTDEQEWDRVKRKWKAEYGGVDNAGKTAWLTGKWKYQQIGLSAREMQNIEASKWTVEQICMQHGVPLSVVGLRDAANFATADIDNQRFKQYTVLPMVKLIEKTVNTDLIAGYAPGIQLKWIINDLINMGKALLDLQPGFDRGVFSVNEMRKAIGLEPDSENPLWEQHFILNTLVPLELAGVVSDQPAVDQQAQDAVQRAALPAPKP